MSSPRISTQSTLGNRCGHLLGGHRPGVPGFDHTTYRRRWDFRQQHYSAVGMHEELNPITRPQPKMFTDRFRDGGLALDGDRGFHLFPPLHISKCNTTATVCTSSQGVSPSVLHPSRLVQGLLSVDRLRSPRAMISPTLRVIKTFLLGSQDRHTGRTLPKAQVMDSSIDSGEDDCWNVRLKPT